MKKLVVLSGGLVAVGSAALVGAGIAMSQPGRTRARINVVGEPYNKALQILKSQGVKGYFGGSFGSVLPQAQCLVDQQKITSGGRMLLMLDCSQKAADMLEAMGPAGGPTGRRQRRHDRDPDARCVPIPGAPGRGRPAACLVRATPRPSAAGSSASRPCCGRPDGRRRGRRSGRAGCPPIHRPAGR